jgi:hypothetical protein
VRCSSSGPPVPGCEIYVINTSATDADAVWVTEVWSTQAELDASLSIESVEASVEQVVALLRTSRAGELQRKPLLLGIRVNIGCSPVAESGNLLLQRLRQP